MGNAYFIYDSEKREFRTPGKADTSGVAATPPVKIPHPAETLPEREPSREALSKERKQLESWRPVFWVMFSALVVTWLVILGFILGTSRGLHPKKKTPDHSVNKAASPLFRSAP